MKGLHSGDTWCWKDYHACLEELLRWAVLHVKVQNGRPQLEALVRQHVTRVPPWLDLAETRHYVLVSLVVGLMERATTDKAAWTRIHADLPPYSNGPAVWAPNADQVQREAWARLGVY